MSIDLEKIRREYSLPDIIASSGVDLVQDGSEYKGCCPFHGEKTPSFSAYREAKKGEWKFHCFGCGIHGSAIDYVQERYGFQDISEAAKFITGELNDRSPINTQKYIETHKPYDGYDFGRPPEGTKEFIAGVRTPPILNPKRINPDTGKPKLVTYTPSMVFPYRNKNGVLIGYVLRQDIKAEGGNYKITPQIWWMNNKAAGFEGWSHGSHPSPRPMYGLPELYENADHQVLIVEGEKCADAAQRLFSGKKKIVSVSWMGGGKSISKTYWKSLAGRSVIIWPDNDVEGWRTTLGYPTDNAGWRKGIIEYLYEAGVEKVKIIHITPDSRKDGWDIADAEAEGLNTDAVSAIIKDRIRDWPREKFEAWRTKQIEKKLPQGEQGNGRNEHEIRGTIDETNSDKSPDRSGGGGESEAGNSSLPVSKTDSNDEGGNKRNGAGSKERDDKSRDAETHASEPIGRGFGIDDTSWRSHLIYKADGDGLKSNSLQNFSLILQYEMRFAGIFSWNEFASETYLMRRPPWDISGKQGHWVPRKLTEPDIIAAACWLEYCGMAPKVNDIGKVIMRVAEHNKYNPVTESLMAMVWDGVERLSGAKNDFGDGRAPWLSEYMKAEYNAANNLFGRKWMIGAVARAMQAGCKMDTMLILEGEQGLRKSSALRVLSDAVTPHVFTDEISDPNSKDAALQLQGAFIVEIAELDAFKKAEVTAIKSWIAREKDRFRRPYGKIIEEFPRSCVFAGTVNPLGGAGYLKDPTGARRFWPVKVGEIDLKALERDAPQLWAEAMHYYLQGEKWWMSKEEEQIAKGEQERRYEDDPYGEIIDEFISMHTSVNMNMLYGCLEIAKKDRNAITSRRIMGHLMVKGWTRVMKDGKVYFDKPLNQVLV